MARRNFGHRLPRNNHRVLMFQQVRDLLKALRWMILLVGPARVGDLFGHLGDRAFLVRLVLSATGNSFR